MADMTRLVTGTRFHLLTRFRVTNSFFLTMEHAPALFAIMSQAMPSLFDLGLLDLLIPMAFVCGLTDRHFIRRPSHLGTPLQHLSLSCYCDMDALPPWSAASSSSFDTAHDSLPLKRAALRTLELATTGSGRSSLTETNVPQVSIHPLLLHGLESLVLDLVHLLVLAPPPRPPRPGTCNDSPPLTTRLNDHVAAPLDSITLPNLRRLHIVTKRMHQDVSKERYPLHRQLPRCPVLEELVVDHSPYPTALDAHSVMRMLAKYPTLVHANVGHASVSRAEMQEIAGTLWACTTGTHDRLRNLVVSGSTWTINIKYVSVPHVLHVGMDGGPGWSAMGPGVGELVLPTSAELRFPSEPEPGRLPVSDGDSRFCAKCRIWLRVPAVEHGPDRVINTAVFVNQHQGRMEVMAHDCECPNCAPAGFEWEWESGVGVGKCKRVWAIRRNLPRMGGPFG
ncbi:hypothetical protein BCR44DRAFT_348526 [Catenaria anguillulae PL171]|uniref:Uncharacterized protein n=1 Tax=Catenaria anguillulae PL171 TaxID=765915 RepID=A0A1Y2I2X0_9FUNG|nr:hypothetical protein BCR44DRAFT_348526 [Catenaria anguillulae PL171]